MNQTIKDKKLYIFDQDGTIYLGGIVFPCAVKFINWLRENGKRVMFFTNNASHNPDFYLAKLTRLAPGLAAVVTMNHRRRIPRLAEVVGVVAKAYCHYSAAFAGNGFFHGNIVNSVEKLFFGIRKLVNIGKGFAAVLGNAVFYPSKGGVAAVFRGCAVRVEIYDLTRRKFRKRMGHMPASAAAFVIDVKCRLAEAYSVIFSFDFHTVILTCIFLSLYHKWEFFSRVDILHGNHFLPSPA
jgi:hypothetical protein